MSTVTCLLACYVEIFETDFDFYFAVFSIVNDFRIRDVFILFILILISYNK